MDSDQVVIPDGNTCPDWVQVVNLVTNRVARILGKVENTERFLRVALYQGIPKQGSVTAQPGGFAAHVKKHSAL